MSLTDGCICQASATFLALLHQQLITASTSATEHPVALPVSITSTEAPQTGWSDLALLVNEQVSLLISQHKRTTEKVFCAFVVCKQGEIKLLINNVKGNGSQYIMLYMGQGDQKWQFCVIQCVPIKVITLNFWLW